MKSTIAEIFDAVSSHRHGRVFHSWDVLSDAEMKSLDTMLQKAMNVRENKKDPELIESFRIAYLSLKHLEAMPKTHMEYHSSNAPTYDPSDNSYQHRIVGTSTVPGNPDRDRAILQTEKGLYEALQKHNKHAK
jgi:hypothetical protein